MVFDMTECPDARQTGLDSLAIGESVIWDRGCIYCRNYYYLNRTKNIE
jgi:hypothetical protein